jgi:hypothetical protein
VTKSDIEYYANVENMDIAVGRVLDYLRSSGLEESTFVCFLPITVVFGKALISHYAE